MKLFILCAAACLAVVVVAAQEPPGFTFSPRDLFDPLSGLLRGAANGDFARNVLTRLGVLQKGATDWRAPENLPWPRVFMEIINEMETTLARAITSLQQVLRQVDNQREG